MRARQGGAVAANASAELGGVAVASECDPDASGIVPKPLRREAQSELVVQQIDRSAARHADAAAVVCGGVTCTYAELDERSARLAGYLVALGVGPGVRVGVCLQPSPDVLVALLAVLRAGGAYLPLDPTYPAAFLASLVEDAAPSLILAHSSANALPLDVPRLDLDTAASLLRGITPWRKDQPRATLDDPAYVIFTSGTTGKPKGVLATHRNLSHYLGVARELYGFDSNDVFVSLARYTFSISLFELLSPLCCGGVVHLLTRDEVLSPPRLVQCLQAVTVLHAGPSLLGSLFRYQRSNAAAPQSFPNVRHASSGGDLVSPQVVQRMKLVFNEAELFVIYGCTEVSCMGLTYAIPRHSEVTRSFVGKPFPSVRAALRDESGERAPVGAVGEIHLSGRGVTQGYLNRDDLTRERYQASDGQVEYRTGDLGRLHEDGNIEILGRLDSQVQVRGVRVELTGIENAIRDAQLAEQCAVVLREHGEGDSRLVAFVVEPVEANTARFRRVLSEHLPDYAVPQMLVVLDAMPLTPNGKLDRRALQSRPLDPTPGDQRPNADTLTPLQQRIRAAFAHVLELEEHQIGTADSFFDLGGHSLTAVVLADELENVLGVSVSAGDLFEHDSVAALARLASGAFTTDPRPIALTTDAGKPPLYMLAGVHLYRQLARKLHGEYSVHGVYVGRELEMLERGERIPSIEVLAQEYLEILLRHQPRGPYCLGGMSFGGIVAYEVAQQLRARGAEVAFLCLIDSVLPEVGWGRILRRTRRFLGLSWREMRRLVWRSLLRRLRPVVGVASANDGPDAEFIRHEPSPDCAVASIERARQRVYQDAARRYARSVRRASFPVTLVVSGQRLARNPLDHPECGWSRYTSELSVLRLDASHFELIEAPHVGQLANYIVAARAPANLAEVGAVSLAVNSKTRW